MLSCESWMFIKENRERKRKSACCSCEWALFWIVTMHATLSLVILKNYWDWFLQGKLGITYECFRVILAKLLRITRIRSSYVILIKKKRCKKKCSFNGRFLFLICCYFNCKLVIGEQRSKGQDFCKCIRNSSINTIIWYFELWLCFVHSWCKMSFRRLATFLIEEKSKSNKNYKSKKE